MSIIVATCSLHTNRNSSKAMAWSIVGASLFAVIIDARLRIFVIAVPMRPRASHQRPKDHDNLKTNKKDKAEPIIAVSYTHLRAHETDSYLVCRLLLEKKKK